MIKLTEEPRVTPYFEPIPLTDLPLLYQREHLFPYTSFGDTSDTPIQRTLSNVVMENDFLRVEVAPELGGRVYSMYDKRINKEMLFSNPVIKPVRILPIWNFISGGIEFNFPIAHSPTSLSKVGCTSGIVDSYVFIRVGEREARTGMEWVVELGLLEDQPFLIQRTAFRNQTGTDHPWMSWTICAVPSTKSTEYIHPPHEVMIHDGRVETGDWPGDGLNWNRNFHEMTALFWKPGSAPHFGAYHHDEGFGLMHVADPEALPGKKVWTYGFGDDRSWSLGTTEGDQSYAELESGPLIDQGEKPMFESGGERRYEEFWIPVHSREACDDLSLPALELPPMDNPWLGYEHSTWQTEWECFSRGAGGLPHSVVPTGLKLEQALRDAVKNRVPRADEELALWLAFRGRHEDAREFAAGDSPRAQWIAGLIALHRFNDNEAAMSHFENGPMNDPVVIAKLDEVYESLGRTDKRENLLNIENDHWLIVERKINLALTLGKVQEALDLLLGFPWQRQHQRYVRTKLWKEISDQLDKKGEKVPVCLGEDSLAQFGAYWAD